MTGRIGPRAQLTIRPVILRRAISPVLTCIAAVDYYDYCVRLGFQLQQTHETDGTTVWASLRNTESRPFLILANAPTDATKQWLEQNISPLSYKSEMAKAIRYALRRWEALARYTDDGPIAIDK